MMVFAVLKKKKFIVSLILIIAVACSVMFFGLKGAVNTFGKQKRDLPIYNVKTDEKKIAISFDCAWGVDYTDKLLSIMEKEGVKCTFFMVEFWTKKHPDYVKKIFDAGHEVGTHSATHPYMSKLSKEAIVKELSSSKKAIEDITGKDVTVFRAPYGDYNNLLIQTAKELGLYTIQWDVDSLDWKDLSAEQISSRVLKKAKGGSIVLFHNQGLHTAEALPEIIGRLKAQGYTFVPIGELIYKENYQVDSNGTQIKNS
ncbi:MAG: polysaccharide deacetylase family protein [Clostridia bacterium]|nr:polysaccharide deacetylase family protein [Clostridia bacterium]